MGTPKKWSTLLLQKRKKLALYDATLEKKAETKSYDLSFQSALNKASTITREKQKIITLSTGKFLHQFSLTPNATYPWRWLIWGGVYLGSAFLSFGLLGIFRRNVEKRYLRENRMNQLQALSLNKQIDPHFILNTLNNIDWMYRNQEWGQASEIMGKLSRLMQSSVRHTTQLTVTLFEELDFCRNYCAIEVNRTPQFQYHFTVGDHIDPKEVVIPRQLIFTHVENAIKHGLRPKPDGPKELSIELNLRGTKLYITVVDTGIGRKTSTPTRGTERGLKLLHEIIDLHLKIAGVKIEMPIEDLEDGGTAVRLIIPVVPVEK